MSEEIEKSSRSSGRRRKRSSNPSNSALEAFRRETGGAKVRSNSPRPPISTREKLVAFFLGLALVVPVWMKGSMSLLAHWFALGCVCLAFVSLWIPMRRPSLHNLNAPPQFSRRLLFRFPLFWLGLALLAYVLASALNPRMEISYIRNFQLRDELDFIPWLPAGIDAPLPTASSWKVLLQWSTLWLGLCALWVGCRRRRTIHFLFWLGTINTTVVGLVGVVHSFSGSQNYLWGGERMNGYSLFGPFLYDNHASCFLLIGLGMMGSLFLIHLARSLLSANGAYVFLGTLFLVTLVTIFMTRSRSGIALAILAILLFTILAILNFRQQRGSFGIMGWISGTLFLGGTILLLALVPWQRIGGDFKADKVGGLQADFSVRAETYKATFEMWQEAPVLGWGAGSFRYVFPEYQERHPLIANATKKYKQTWAQAHNEWVQILAEYGLIGFSLILAGVIWIFGRAFAWRKNITTAHLMAFGTGLLVLVQAGVDFVFHNPAVLLSFSLLVVGTARLMLSEREMGG